MPRIVLIGSLRNTFGSDSLTVEGIGSEITFPEFVRRVLEEDRRFEAVFNTDGTPRPGYLVLIDGVDVRVFEDLSKAIVKPDSTITIIPVVHGG